jgi:hypothetical protein
MQFNDTSAKNGLIQDCESMLFGDKYGTISSNSDLLATFTRLLNQAYNKAVTVIMQSDGRWQFDDTNHTDLPIGSTDLAEDQDTYTLDAEHLRVLKVYVRDSAGNLLELRPIDIQDPESKLMYQNFPVTKGVPTHYDKQANILKLYPTPNYTVADNGLVVHYQRLPLYFTSADTTKVAGIPKLFSRYLSLCASIDYATAKQMSVKNDLFAMASQMEKDIKDWYSTRSKDESKTLRGKFRSSR